MEIAKTSRSILGNPQGFKTLEIDKYFSDEYSRIRKESIDEFDDGFFNFDFFFDVFIGNESDREYHINFNQRDRGFSLEYFSFGSENERLTEVSGRFILDSKDPYNGRIYHFIIFYVF